MILLETHVVVWMASAPEKLWNTATYSLRKAARGGGVAIAASTLSELAQLVTSGKFTIAGAVDAFLEGTATRVVVIPINPKVAMLGTRFSAPYPRDQADRLIGAKAVAEGIALVTKDRDIRTYGQVKTIW